MAASALILLLALAGDLEAAEKALAEGRAADAIDLLGALADGDDAAQRALIVVGRAHLALQQYESAVDPLLRASDAAPKDTELARDAAYACWGSASGAYARAYLEDARRYAQRSGEIGLLADILYELGDFEEARKRYESLLEEQSLRAHALLRIAECHVLDGETEAARKAYAAVLEDAIEREDLAATYRAAFQANAGGRLLAWLDQRVAGNPDDTWALLYRGYARARVLLYAEAIEDLRAVVERRPEDLTVKARLAQVLVNHGMAEQRTEALREGERLAVAIIEVDAAEQTAGAILRALSWYAWVNRDVEHSYALLKRLNALDPGERDVGLNYAAMARRLGHYEEAGKALLRVLEEYPDDPAVLTDLGILEDGQGDRAAAVELWKKVLEEDARDLNALENLYTWAWENGDAEALEEYLERGLEAARRVGNDRLVERWLWFRDRLRWAPVGHGAG